MKLQCIDYIYPNFISLTQRHNRNDQSLLTVQATHVTNLRHIEVRRPVNIIRAIVKNSRCMGGRIETTKFVDQMSSIEVFDARVVIGVV